MPASLKIGFDARALMAKSYSGVSWYVYYLLKALLALDKQNEYRLFFNSSKHIDLPDFGAFGGGQSGNGAAGEDAPRLSYIYRRFPNKFFNFCLRFWGWPKIDQLLGGVDWLVAPNWHFLAWSKKVRKILVVHDLSFLRFPEFFNGRMRFWHKLILRRAIFAEAEVIVADSQSTKNDLMEILKVPAEKIKVIYLGVGPQYRPIAGAISGANKDNSATPAEADAAILSAARQKYDLPVEFVLFLGTMEPRKNIPGLIKAFVSLLGDREMAASNQPLGVSGATPDLYLVLAGGYGWKSQAIKKILKTMPKAAREKIKLIGYVAEEDKPALYNMAQMLVYPSFYEGFGLPLLEAMACGCPVVAGANSSQGEVIGAAGLLVNPFNINEIKQAMAAFLNNQDLRRNLTAAGLARARRFSWSKTANEFLAIMNK